jgi:hypothetical protein
MHGTPDRANGRGSEKHFAASSGDAPGDDTRKRFGQEFDDPLPILRTHWADDLPPPFRQIGDVALGVVAGQLDRVGGGR